MLSGTVPDVEHDHGGVLDGEENAVHAPASAI